MSRKSTAPRRATQPRLEMLEDRCLLSAILVTSTADANTAGTLRYAINQANAGKYNEMISRLEQPAVRKPSSSRVNCRR